MPEPDSDEAIWALLRRHLHSIFNGDVATYRETTAPDLSLYEWFVSPHRQDGLDFHFFMIEHGWAGEAEDYRFDLLEPRLQRYGDMAIASYTFMLTRLKDGAISHHLHNESRVLVKMDGGWRVVHVHKSPAAPTPAGG